MLFSLILVSFACAAQDQEIVSFKSAITINADATMRVHEIIAITIPGQLHRRGLIRDFPTTYKDRLGNRYTVGFAVTAVRKDGRTEPYHIKQASNGVRIFIGDKDIYLPSGTYTYDIEYETNRHLGFFEDHDELYWNVTGNGWPFTIHQASVDLFLPKKITAESITLSAYTGAFGTKGQDFAITMPSAGHVHIETTRALSANQGLTVAVGWPKGVVAAPTWWTNLSYFILDNLSLLCLLVGLLLLIAYCAIHYLRIQAANGTRIIIPLFYPPKDLSPAQVRAFNVYGYDDTAFAAELVNMAVHGLITLECKKKLFGSEYTIKKVVDPVAHSPEVDAHKPFMDVLFAKQDTLKLDRENESVITKAKANIYAHVTRIASLYFDGHADVVVGAVVIAIGVVFVGFALAPAQGVSGLFLPLVAAIIATVFLTNYGVRGYTKDGLALKNEIDGFGMFLAATEKDRMEIVGTPPTRTPELYEKYLPYAMALGLEKQWTQQFASVFAQMAKQGHAYMPLWYHGPFRHDFANTSFASDLSSSLNQAISSSGTVPGKSSGSHDSGSSGGGGGGGGGGTW